MAALPWVIPTVSVGSDNRFPVHEWRVVRERTQALWVHDAALARADRHEWAGVHRPTVLASHTSSCLRHYADSAGTDAR